MPSDQFDLEKLLNGELKAVGAALAAVDSVACVLCGIYYYGCPFVASILALLACKILLLVYIINSTGEVLVDEYGCRRRHYEGAILPLYVRSLLGAVIIAACHGLVWLWRTSYYAADDYWDTRSILFYITFATGYAAAFLFLVLALLFHIYYYY